VPSFRQKSASSGYVRWHLGQVRTITHRAVEGLLSRAYTTTLDVNEQRSCDRESSVLSQKFAYKISLMWAVFSQPR